VHNLSGSITLNGNLIQGANGAAWTGTPPAWTITDKANYISFPAVDLGSGSQEVRFAAAPNAGDVQEDVLGVFEESDGSETWVASGTREDCTVANAKLGFTYGDPDAQLSGLLVVGGSASYGTTLAKTTGAAARGGSGTCAKLTPPTSPAWGTWDFYTPGNNGVEITLSFYHEISAGWDGLLKVTIYDTDQVSELLSSGVVSITDDSAYHQYVATGVTPTGTGFCRISIEIQDGASTGYVYIDDISII